MYKNPYELKEETPHSYVNILEVHTEEVESALRNMKHGKAAEND